MSQSIEHSGPTSPATTPTSTTTSACVAPATGVTTPAAGGDCQPSLTVGSLFSGIGGLLDLGLERAGMRVAWQAENDPFCADVLGRHWPDVPNLGDVTSIDWAEVPRVDLICGGFPCQDISDAHTNGTREALAGAKSGLWTEYLEAVARLFPRFVIVENVAAWRRWVPEVRADLSALGYASLPVELSAGSFGAPHKRPRVLVVADAHSEGESLRAIDAEVARLRPIPRGSGHWRLTEPSHLRVAHGTPGRMDRLRALGNAVVPQVAEHIGRLIAERVA